MFAVWAAVALVLLVGGAADAQSGEPLRGDVTQMPPLKDVPTPAPTPATLNSSDANTTTPYKNITTEYASIATNVPPTEKSAVLMQGNDIGSETVNLNLDLTKRNYEGAKRLGGGPAPSPTAAPPAASPPTAAYDPNKFDMVENEDGQSYSAAEYQTLNDTPQNTAGESFSTFTSDPNDPGVVYALGDPTTVAAEGVEFGQSLTNPGRYDEISLTNAGGDPNRFQATQYDYNHVDGLATAFADQGTFDSLALDTPPLGAHPEDSYTVYKADSFGDGAFNADSYASVPLPKDIDTPESRLQRAAAYELYAQRSAAAKEKAKYYHPRPKPAPRTYAGYGGGNSGGVWRSGRSTFYGGADASGTMAGACGFGNLYATGYGTETAALSTILFKNGLACGACYEVKCVNNAACLPGSVIVTATNFCPPNPGQSAENGGWCNIPNEHFDMAEPAFAKIAKCSAGVVPISYRRVNCVKQGGIRFTINGNCNFNLVTVTNVGGSGVVTEVFIKGDLGTWTKMSRSWGSNWQSGCNVCGQGLSFRVITSDGKSVESRVADASWKFGKAYQGTQVY